MSVRSLLSVAIGFVLAGFSVASAQEVKLARNELSPAQAIAAKILTDVYTKAGLMAKVEALPATRANAMALAGEKDGEVGRIGPYFVKNSSLVKVEPKFYYLTTTAFVKGGKIKITSKEDLKKYKVAIVRGIAHAAAATEGVPSLEVVDDYEAMYKLLDAGRVDVVVDEAINGPFFIKKLGLKDLGSAGNVAAQDLFNVLTPKKKDLSEKISAAITAMTSSGELAKLQKQYEDDFINGKFSP